MLTRKCAAFIFILLLTLTPTLAVAQDTKGATPVPQAQAPVSANDPGVTALVQSAFNSLQNSGSYHSQTIVSAYQVLTATGYDADFRLTFHLDADVVPNGPQTLDDFYSTSEVEFELEESTSGSQALSATFDTVAIEGQVFTNTSQDSSQTMPLNQWLPDGAAPQGLPIPFDRNSLEPFSFFYLVNPQTVMSAVEVEANTLDDQPVRVFELQLNPEVLRQLGVISLTGIGEGTDTNLTASFDGLGTLTANTTYELVVSIGTNDGLPHRVDYVFENSVFAQQQEASARQRVAGRTDFSAYNVPVTIVNPMANQIVATIEIGGKPSEATAVPPAPQQPAATEAVTSSGIGGQSSGAGDPESVVSAAYGNLQALSSYHAEGSAAAAQTLTTTTTDAEFALEFSNSMDVIPNGPNVVDTISGTTDLHLTSAQSGRSPQDIQAEIAIVIIDGTSYGQVLSANQDIGQSIGQWVAEAIPGGPLPIPYDRMNTEPFLFLYLINPNTIASVTELPGETLNGQAMRVFDVSLNIEALRGLGVMSPTGIGEGTNTNLTLSFDGMGQVTGDAAYNLRIWIGANDGLPYRIEYTFTNDVTTQSGNGSAVQSVEGAIDYSNFNAPVSIVPPAL